MEEPKKQKKINHDGYTRDTREFLDNYGHSQIYALSVVIVPLPFLLPLILNLVTRREFNNYMKKKGFERMYHWELMATIEVNGEKRNVILQKAGEIDINFDKKSYSYYYKSLISNKRFIDIPLTNEDEVTIDTILSKTRKKLGYADYYTWSMMGETNCQGFVKAVLESNDLYTVNPILETLYQSSVGEAETEFIQNHAVGLFLIDTLAYLSIYAYILFRYLVKYISQKIVPQFSKYMNI